jgi:hypothetical protein
MGRLWKILAAALPLLTLTALLASPTVDVGRADGGNAPSDSTVPVIYPRNATSISAHTATLRAKIDPNADGDKQDAGGSAGASYHFEFGPASSYGFSSASGILQGDDTTNVSVAVTGLAAGTTYHFRAVASNSAGTAYGTDVSFRTTGSGDGASGPKADGPTPEPELGHMVVADEVAGDVLVKDHGDDRFHPLDSTEAIPVNSVVDSTNGTVGLVTALGGGHSQKATLHGGKFEVRQSRSGHGMTNIALRGGDFSSCSTQRRARGSGRVERRLWAKDHHGHFKTSGKGSVATVRGTSWYTADTCDGTLTRVSSGEVLVRQRGTGKQKLLTRGQSFFARAGS